MSRRTRICSAAMVAGLTLAVSACDLHPADQTMPGQAAVGDDGYTVTVTFDRVENLVANSAVLQDDVTVGTVTRIEVVDWQAEVTLRILDDVELPGNTTFSIGQKTLLGAQYVEVDVPSAEETEAALQQASADPAAPAISTEPLTDGSTVGVEQTGTYPATEQVLASASLLLNNGGLSQLNIITTELNATLDGNVPDVQSVIGRLNELLGVLDANREQMITVLEDLDGLAGQLAAERESIGNAIDVLTPAIQALEEERPTLVAAVDRIGEAGVVASDVIEANTDLVIANLAALQPTLEELASVGASIPEALKFMITLPFPVMSTDEAIKGDYANLYATIDVSLPALTERFLGSDLGVDLPFLDRGEDPVTDPLEGSAGTETDPGATTEDSAPTESESEGSGEPGGSATSAPTTTAPSAEPEDDADASSDCNPLSFLLGGCS